MTIDKNQEIEMLLRMAERAGISADDLIAARDGGAGCPTLREFRQAALDAITDTKTLETRKTYIDYLIDGHPLLVCTCACRRCGPDTHCGSERCTSGFAGLGKVPLRNIRAQDIVEAGRVRAALVVSDAHARARRHEERKPGSSRPVTTTGVGAVKHVYGAARHIMRVAVEREVLLASPLGALKDPRSPSARSARSYEPEVFDAIVEELCLGGDDPELDALLTAFRLETGARSGGELNLKVSGLKVSSGYVSFGEKRSRTFDKPISRPLMDALLAHVAERGDPDAGPDGPVFHYRPDKPYRHWSSPTEWETRVGYHPVGKSRMETIIGRIKRTVPEAREQDFRLHDLRHHVGSILERAFGEASAAAYLGHVPDNPTSGYTRTRDSEIADHHRWLTGDDRDTADGQDPTGTNGA